MRLIASALLLSLLAFAGLAHAQAFTAQSQSSTAALPSSVAASPQIAGSSYLVTNGVAYAKTATGLLVVLSPAVLTGSGPLAGSSEGLTLEIPDFFIQQLF